MADKQKSVSFDKITRSDRKTMAVEITVQGKVILRLPHTATKDEIITFVSKHAEWIAEKQNIALKRSAARFQERYKEGGLFLYKGEWYPMHIVDDIKSAIIFNEAFYINEKVLPKARAAFEWWYKRMCPDLYNARLKYWSDIMKAKYVSVRLSGARTRWGSCSSAGSVNLSWRLIMAPEWVLDSVIVHEFAHLTHLNHSKNFWNLVEQFFPRHKEADAWLKLNHKHLVL